MQIAFLGPEGTYSEEAARRYRGRVHAGAEVDLVAIRSIPDLLLAVDRGEYELGIVPVENSIEGPVVLTLDMLAHEVDLRIVAEEVLPIHHRLLTRPGVLLEQVVKVVSHPQALGQCRHTLNRLLPQAEAVTATSTAEAVRIVAAAAEPWAAIGTESAGRRYGLCVAANEVQDVPENATRFVVVGKGSAPRTGFDKTSVVFAFRRDKPGNLYNALREFAVRDINLTKLESRPAKKSLGDYIFFVDMEGHIEEGHVREALAGLERMCALFRLLGSYPRTAYSPRSEQQTANGTGSSELSR